MITVLRAPPFATVQDEGRFGHVYAAVPRAGALDAAALAVANILVGNPRDAAVIEWGLGGGEVRFERTSAFALTGAVAGATLGGRGVAGYARGMARPGETLSLGPPEGGAWLYVAVAGGIDVPPVLGSRATYLPGGFGGLGGRLLRAGDRLPVGDAPAEAAPPETIPDELCSLDPAQPIALLPGPDRWVLDEVGWDALLGARLTVSRAVSRMGYQLEGLVAPPAVPGDLPSAPACIGTVQLPAGGEPIVLLHDGPTVGGYARVGVLATADIRRLAQRRPGDLVRFQESDPDEARARLRRRAQVLAELARRA